MSTNCNSCNCGDNGLTTQHNCSDSYPECVYNNPCDEIISDLCVIHQPNGMMVELSPGNNFVINNNENIYSILQKLMMYNSSLYMYVLSSNTYGPILGLRTLWIGTTTFKLYWDFPNVPPPQTQPTLFRITITKASNTSNYAVYDIDSTYNSFVPYNYGSFIITPNTSYYVKVELIDVNTNNILTSSITIIVTTKNN